MLGQQNVTFEWVMKDGLSTDGTQDQTWSEARVKFVSRRDGGIFDAMNQALNYCGGDYVLFLNTGDVFCGAHSLEQVARAIEEHQRPEIVYTYYEDVDPGVVAKYPSRLTAAFLYRRSVCHQATFVRRDCYSRYGGFATTFRIVADDELLARLVLRERVRYALCPVAVVRVEEWKSSWRPENRERWRQERQAIRQQYLTPGQRFRAGLMYAATLPILRKQWIVLPNSSRWRRLYLHASNFVYKHL